MQRLKGSVSWKPNKRKKGAPMRPPRPAHSYRGARRNEDRRNPRSASMWEERILNGETRSEADARRELRRRQREGIDAT
jgi:hypothetical protein